MDAAAVPPHLPSQLSHRFDERQRLDVAYRAADLGDYKIKPTRLAQRRDMMFDLIGNMRDDLYGLAQIIAAPPVTKIYFVSILRKVKFSLRAAKIVIKFDKNKKNMLKMHFYLHISQK